MRVLVLAVAMVAALPASAQATIRAFRSPSGAIGCIYYRDPDTAASVRCDVVAGGDRAWTVHATGRARRIHVTDSALDSDAPVLAYGKTRRFGRISCTSRRSGVTCRNTDGHGFAVARQRQRLFCSDGPATIRP
jgi:hypothetical protein